MKRKILIIIAAVLVFGIFAAAYAYQSNTAAPVEKAACCDMADCCCKDGHGAMNHDSCPMKDKHENTAATASADGESCCPCCKGSCPMHKNS